MLAVLSIAGDTFSVAVRGRALGIINSGEIVGNGIGLLAAGALAAAFAWRSVFWLLGAAGFGLVYLLLRLPDPPRGAGATTSPGGESATC